MASDQPTTVAVMNEQHSVRWWSPLSVHGRHILLSAIPVAAIAAMLLSLIDPVFVSHALVEVTGPDTDRPAGDGNDLRVLMGTQREIVASFPLAGALRENFVVEAVPDTSLLAIHYQAPDPVSARDGANTVARKYVDYTATTQLAEIESAAALMVRKLEGVKSAVNTAYDIQNSDRLKNSDGDSSVIGLLELIPPLYSGARELNSMQMPDQAGGELISNLVETTLVRQVVGSYDASVTRVVSAKILNPASLPPEPQARPISLWILLSYLSAVVVPAGVLVARFQWRITVDLPQDVEHSLGLRCLGTVPLMAEMPSDGCSDQGKFPDALRALSTELRLLRAPRNPLEQFPKGRIILVTSGHAGEGKSTVASSLAATLGRLEKVLLIDADMRHARTCFGIAAGAPGLSHLIAGAAQMRDCIHRVAGKNIDVIPTGVLPPNPQELLANRRLQRILDMLERRYDTIIIDSPALAEVSDTLTLARRCSDLIYVVAARLTRTGNARAHIARLNASGASIAGVVLNRFATTKNATTTNFKASGIKIRDLKEMDVAYESR